MKFKLEINMDNASFDPLPGMELGRILRETAHCMGFSVAAGDNGRAIDANGNTVGGWEVVTGYELRCRELEARGLTRSDAQGIADMEGVRDD